MLYLIFSNHVAHGNFRFSPLVALVARYCEEASSIYLHSEWSHCFTIHMVKEGKAHFPVEIQKGTAKSCNVALFSGIRCLGIHVITCEINIQTVWQSLFDWIPNTEGVFDISEFWRHTCDKIIKIISLEYLSMLCENGMSISFWLRFYLLFEPSSLYLSFCHKIWVKSITTINLN